MRDSPPAPTGWGFCSGRGGWGRPPSLLPAAVTLGFAGVGTGVINTYGISWLQRRTDPAMQGRVMSLVMLASMGLTRHSRRRARSPTSTQLCRSLWRGDDAALRGRRRGRPLGSLLALDSAHIST